MNFRNIRLGSTPLTIGLIFGVILAFVLVLYSFIGGYVNQVLGTIGLFLDLAIYILFGFLAGRRASRLTGKLSSGVVAGAMAGLVSSILYGIFTLALIYLNIDFYVRQAQIEANKHHPIIPITPGYLMQLELAYLVTPLLFSFLVVLMGGMLGGFLGKGRARLAPAEETPGEVITTATPVQDAEETPGEVITTATPAQDDEVPTPSYSSNGARRTAASRRSRNARRNRSMN